MELYKRWRIHHFELRIPGPNIAFIECGIDSDGEGSPGHKKRGIARILTIQVLCHGFFSKNDGIVHGEFWAGCIEYKPEDDTK